MCVWTLNTVLLFLLLGIFVAGYLQTSSFERNQVRKRGAAAVTTTESSVMFWKTFLFSGWVAVLGETWIFLKRKMERKKK